MSRKPAYIAFLAIERSTKQEFVEAALEGNNSLQLLPKKMIAVRPVHSILDHIHILYL